jgi:excisionase family DNA binding protein
MPKRLLHNPDELTTFELAQYLGVSRPSIDKWARQGSIPAPAKCIGNKRLWTRAQAEEIKRMVK